MTPLPSPLPPVPTDALPGTYEKILVLADRAGQQCELHHPDDVTFLTRRGPRALREEAMAEVDREIHIRRLIESVYE